MARLPQPLSALRPMSRWFQHSGACSSSVSCNRHWNPAVIVAGAGLGLGYYSEYGNKARPGCEEGGEAYWWKDPSKCSDASSLWRRGWDSDWDGRAKPTSSCTTPVKTTGPIRHLLLIRHGQYNLDDDEHGLTGSCSEPMWQGCFCFWVGRSREQIQWAPAKPRLTDLGREQSAKLGQRRQILLSVSKAGCHAKLAGSYRKDLV